MVGRAGIGYSQKMEQDAIVVLSEDHAAAQALFARVSQPDEDRPAVLGQLLRMLSAHVAAEKQLVVPILLEHSDEGEALADQLRDDHDAIEKLVILVERRKVNSPDVPDLVNELLAITKRHVRQADEELVPFLRGQLSAAELADLGTALRSDELQPDVASPPASARHGPIGQGHPQSRRPDRPGPRFNNRSSAPWSLMAAVSGAAITSERPDSPSMMPARPATQPLPARPATQPCLVDAATVDAYPTLTPVGNPSGSTEGARHQAGSLSSLKVFGCRHRGSAGQRDGDPHQN